MPLTGHGLSARWFGSRFSQTSCGLYVISGDKTRHDTHNQQHERFYLTHFAGCAVLFNKDTFYTDISVKSIYLHDTRRILPDHFVEGEHGWVLQGVVSRASFRRAAASGQTVFTVLSLHINNVYAKNEVLPRKSSRPFVLF